MREARARTMTYQEIPTSVSLFIERITDLCGVRHPAWAKVFRKAFAKTLSTTVRREKDGTTFLLTGDIPAMWLRDSTAQVRPYLVIARDDDDMAAMISGLVRRQFAYICIDPYANAFNETPSGAAWDPNDRTDFTSPWLWERKYESAIRFSWPGCSTAIRDGRTSSTPTSSMGSTEFWMSSSWSRTTLAHHTSSSGRLIFLRTRWPKMAAVIRRLRQG